MRIAVAIFVLLGGLVAAPLLQGTLLHSVDLVFVISVCAGLVSGPLVGVLCGAVGGVLTGTIIGNLAAPFAVLYAVTAGLAGLLPWRGLRSLPMACLTGLVLSVVMLAGEFVLLHPVFGVRTDLDSALLQIAWQGLAAVPIAALLSILLRPRTALLP